MRRSFHFLITATSRSASRRLAVSLVALLWLAAAPALASRPKLTHVRIGVHKKFTRVVLQTDAAVRHRIHKSSDEVRVRLDATSPPRAVTAKSPQLIWVKVSPTSSGSEVRIQLRHPADVKQMVLRKPDRLVLDLYPASRAFKQKAAAATPAPPEKPTTAVGSPTPAPPSAAGSTAGAAAAGATAGEAAAPPAAKPSGEAVPAAPPPEAPAPPVAAQGTPEAGEAGGAAAGPGAQGGLEAGGPAPPTEAAPSPLEQQAEVPRPLPPPHPPRRTLRSPLDFLPPPFDQPISLGLIAVLLLTLFVLLRVRRRRVAQEGRAPFPPGEEEEAEPTPVQEVAALGRETKGPAAEAQPRPTATAPPPPFPPPSAPPLPPAAPGAAPAAAAAAPGEMERRVSHLESRLEEVLDAKERLERQVAAQTEELRVQRAAIARTQRVLRTIARPEDEATEPAPKA